MKQEENKMTVATTNSRISYAGSGISIFQYPYEFQNKTDLGVLLQVASTGVITSLTYTTDYTVTGTQDPVTGFYLTGGTITTTNAVPSGTNIVIYRASPALQNVSITQAGPFPSKPIESALDSNILALQRALDLSSRAAHLPDGFSTTFDTTLPPNLAVTPNAAIIVNAAGNGFAAGPTADAISGAQASATAAAASASSASSSASAASTSASSASTSAAAAQAAAQAAIWRDVVFKTFADSPLTITSSDRGKLFVFDSSGGAIAVTLPQISTLDLTSPFNIGIKKESSDGNSITITRGGTDTIDGLTTKVISTPASGTTLTPDTDPSPDQWIAADFGAAAGNITVDAFTGDGTTTAFTVSVSPGSKNNTWAYIGGVEQNIATYSVSGTTLTFSTAPPNAVGIEIKSGTTLSIGTPSDGTVTRAKLATGAIAPSNGTSKSSAYSVITSDDYLEGDATSTGFTFTLPTAASASGRTFTFLKTDSTFNQITVTDGTLTKKLSTQGEMLEVRSNGTAYKLIRRYIPSTSATYSLTIGGTTTAPTLGTNVANVAKWRRVSECMEITYNLQQSSAGSAGSGAYLYPVPSGVTIDTTNVTSPTTQANTTTLNSGSRMLGVGNLQTTTAGNTSSAATLYVSAYNSTNLTVSTLAAVAQQEYPWGSNNFALSVTTLYATFTAMVPITGWEG